MNRSQRTSPTSATSAPSALGAATSALGCATSSNRSRGRSLGRWLPGLLLLAALQGACAARQPVSLDGQWPAQVSSYSSVTRGWTRSTSMTAEYQQVLSVDATLLSPEWRAARAVRDAERRGLGDEARNALMLKAQEDAKGPFEVEVLLTTWDRSENDLHRGKRATWKVALLDDQGNEIAPVDIVRDRRPTYMLQADFPLYGDFAEAYIVRFPKDAKVLGPDVKQVRMRLASARGAVELTWNE